MPQIENPARLSSKTYLESTSYPVSVFFMHNYYSKAPRDILAVLPEERTKSSLNSLISIGFPLIGIFGVFLTENHHRKCPEVVLGSSCALKMILLRRKLHLSVLWNLILRDFQFEAQKFIFKIVMTPSSDFTLSYNREKSVNFAAGRVGTTPGTTVNHDCFVLRQSL